MFQINTGVENIFMNLISGYDKLVFFFFYRNHVQLFKIISKRASIQVKITYFQFLIHVFINFKNYIYSYFHYA